MILRGISDERQEIRGPSGQVLGEVAQDDEGNDVFLVSGDVTMFVADPYIGLCWFVRDEDDGVNDDAS